MATLAPAADSGAAPEVSEVPEELADPVVRKWLGEADPEDLVVPVAPAVDLAEAEVDEAAAVDRAEDAVAPAVVAADEVPGIATETRRLSATGLQPPIVLQDLCSTPSATQF
jgi:hypothetical protein